ncbi:hypothetical protein LCGC14_1411930 [marine sediment metagenome]|uniref:Uncharacterized protein n=1 Tax=marine sediment metagenome TaxID=412755 RepID=A0A0F9M9F2_9ZZZZ
MNIDQIISKKLGLAIAGMWFISKATLQTSIVLAVVAIVGIVAQTYLDVNKKGL